MGGGSGNVTDPPDGGDVVEAANRELVQLAARFSHEFTRWLDNRSGDGLTYTRLKVLELLHCRGSAPMKQLALTLGLSARNLTTVADALETDGLIRRVSHPTDRRSTLLELTGTGMAAADVALEPRLSELGRLFDVLPPEARRRFADALTTLVEAMEQGNLPDPDPPPASDIQARPA